MALDPYDHDPTIADGLAGGFGAVPYALARDLIAGVLLASEADLRRAVYELLDSHQLVAEPSGAISIAPLLDGQIDVRGRCVVCVVTGGNIDTRLLHQILDEMDRSA